MAGDGEARFAGHSRGLTLDEVLVEILEGSGSQVCLGVAAPKDVKNLREGLLDKRSDPVGESLVCVEFGLTAFRLRQQFLT